ncbi:MAG: Smr/MutS family protein, partial [Spirochaetota bacterium]
AGIREGAAVRLKRYGTRATAERRNRDGKWIVVAGSVKMTVAEEDLEPVESPADGAHQQSRAVGPGFPISHIPFELDVRGQRLAEALDSVERQIDDCLAAGRSSFTVLHGKGTGALQRGIHDLLSRRREVLSYDFSRPEEGGTGKTLVTLNV